jgi:hypothetical protein
MGLKTFGKLLVGMAAVCGVAAPAQERGDWRAMSTTARGVTGDVAFTETKLFLNFSGYTIAQIRTLTPAETGAIFHSDGGAAGSGSLYRTDIPGAKRFLHKNTLCGSEDVQWVATSVSGKTLQIAMFSGAAMPKLTADEMANATNLCGTYSYTR